MQIESQEWGEGLEARRKSSAAVGDVGGEGRSPWGLHEGGSDPPSVAAAGNAEGKAWKLECAGCVWAHRVFLVTQVQSPPRGSWEMRQEM